MAEKMRHVGISDVANSPVPPMIVDGIVPSKGILEIIAPPGAGKTFFALECGVAAALGRRAFGIYKVNQCKVLYIGEDSPKWDVGQQLRKMVPHEDWEDLEDRFHFTIHEGARLNEPGQAEAILATMRDFFTEELLDDNGEMESIFVPGMVIYDCLRALHTADENNSDQMASVMRKLKALSMNCSSVVLHHVGKASQVQKAAWEEARGSGEIVAACDGAISISKKGSMRIVEPVRSRGLRLVDFTYEQQEIDDTVRLVAEWEFSEYKQFLLEHPEFGTAEVVDFLSVKEPKSSGSAIRQKATRKLQKMMAQGVIEKRGKGRYKVVGDIELGGDDSHETSLQ